MQTFRFRLFLLPMALFFLLSACSDNQSSKNSPISNSKIQLGGAIQGNSLVLSKDVSSFVGAGTRFNGPSGITTDGTNLYVADSENHVIRKVVISSGAVTTLAGSAGTMGYTDGTGESARFYKPMGITTDGSYLYVTEYGNSTIRKIETTTGVVTTLAGSPYNACSSDFPLGSPASFCGPTGITTVGKNLYVSDTGGSIIRKVDIVTGVITTFAGKMANYGFVDGSNLESRFSFPRGITTNGKDIFVADTGNCSIRKIEIATGNVTTLAGRAGLSGTTDGVGTSARFYYPHGISTDGTNLFVADTGSSTIRKIVIATGEVTTITESVFNNPEGITTDNNKLFVADTGSSTIRKVDINSGLVTIFTGSVMSQGVADGTGSKARFNSPSGITTDGTNLFIADTANHTIRKVEIATGVVTTLAGEPYFSGATDGTGLYYSSFNSPTGITTDGTNLYISDTNNHTIRKIVVATSVVTTLAGSAGNYGSTDGAGESARFNSPGGITTDGVNLYVLDINNRTIRKVVISTGVVTTLAGSGNAGSVEGFYSPSGITTDGINLYVTDYSVIRKIEISTGKVTTLAGQAATLGNDITGSSDGMGAEARFNNPQGVTMDGTNLFVSDTGNNTVRKIEIASGAVTTIAGIVGVRDSSDGKGTSAKFWSPSGITTDGDNLFVVDTGNNTIRKIH